MSDYLGNLAARSLAPAPAVRPRLASRFEAQSPWAPPALAERLDDGPAPQEATVEETAVAPARSPQPAATRRRIAVPELVEDEAPIPSWRHRVRRDPVVEDPEPALERNQPVSTAAPTRPQVESVPAQSLPVHRGLLRFEASPPVPVSRGSREEGRNGEVARVADPDRPEPRTALQPPPRQDQPASPPLSTRVGPENEASRANRSDSAARRTADEASAATVLQPKVTLAQPEPFRDRRETPAPAPTIQVTIGRIEVRATPASKAPVRERPSAPSAPSLEDYLKQRSKGGAR